MGDMGELFRAWEDYKRDRREKNLENAFASGTNGWTVHTPVHWSRTLLGERLDYWPSKKKFRWRGKNRFGTVEEIEGFIRNRERETDDDEAA
jgi:hypothetical protein